jgi:hypothetical protein
MDVDPYELLVRWYLRFNGYLGVENFVVQETVLGGNVQVGETDVLAVRFPHSREDPGFALQNDAKLLDNEAARDSLVDFVVAEVKGRRKDSLNKVWRSPADATKIDRVVYLIRWLGPFSNEEEIRNVAVDLQASHRARRGQCLSRVVMFARKPQPALPMTQVTFYDIAHFLVHVRAPCWKDRGFGSRSPHNQWHPFIKDVWRIADPGTGLDPDSKVQAILKYLDEAAEQRAGADSANT